MNRIQACFSLAFLFCLLALVSGDPNILIYDPISNYAPGASMHFYTTNMRIPTFNKAFSYTNTTDKKNPVTFLWNFSTTSPVIRNYFTTTLQGDTTQIVVDTTNSNAFTSPVFYYWNTTQTAIDKKQLNSGNATADLKLNHMRYTVTIGGAAGQTPTATVSLNSFTIANLTANKPLNPNFPLAAANIILANQVTPAYQDFIGNQIVSSFQTQFTTSFIQKLNDAVIYYPGAPGGTATYNIDMSLAQAPYVDSNNIVYPYQANIQHAPASSFEEATFRRDLNEESSVTIVRDTTDPTCIHVSRTFIKDFISTNMDIFGNKVTLDYDFTNAYVSQEAYLPFTVYELSEIFYFIPSLLQVVRNGTYSHFDKFHIQCNYNAALNNLTFVSSTSSDINAQMISPCSIIMDKDGAVLTKFDIEFNVTYSVKLDSVPGCANPSALRVFPISTFIQNVTIPSDATYSIDPYTVLSWGRRMMQVIYNPNSIFGPSVSRGVPLISLQLDTMTTSSTTEYAIICGQASNTC